MRLKEFTVTGLFGLFNHSIPFHLDQQITIIHAPNGYGKTVIFKLINGFFGNSLGLFGRVEFSMVRFTFDDGTAVTIVPHATDRDHNPTKTESRFLVSLTKGSQKLENWEPRELTDRPRNLPMNLHVIERYITNVTRIGPREYRDDATGETLSVFEAIERNIDRLPAQMREVLAIPKWLTELRQSIHCELIETQRLMIVHKRNRRSWEAPDTPPFMSTVKTFSNQLVEHIKQTLANNATLSTALDRTFPARVLARLSRPTDAPNEHELRTKLSELEQQRTRLTNVALLDKSNESTLIPQAQMEPATRKFLGEYIDDTQKKLSAYDDLLERIEVLLKIVNSRFQFKTLSIDRGSGFVFTDILGRHVSLESLSSGEQHELVLAYGLLFNTKPGSLILLDEPEISLHVAWQKRFLADLRSIIALSPMDVVLSTHSPQLIGGNLDLTVQLRGPERAGESRGRN
jgi:predicted ATP-binding protein involved in virulence